MPHPLRRTSPVHRLAVALFAALLAAAFAWPGTAARAATDDPPDVRWSVSPADESGPDGRRSIENELDPGQIVEDRFAVRNVSAQEVTFRLTAADGFYTRTGRFDILPADRESTGSGTWITLPETVTVPGGGTVVVPFTLTVPERAEPGDHAAGITASVLSVQTAEGGASVGVESRVGFRVLTRVAGEITPAASLTAVSGTYATMWNPLRPGSATVAFDVVNDGNTRLAVQGTVSVVGRSVAFPADGENPQELLPGDTRAITVEVPGVWPLFLAPATVAVDATSVTMDGASEALPTVTADTLVWAVPWPQLIVLIGLALLVWALFWRRARSRRKLDSMLAAAREEGRRTAVPAPVDAS